MKEYRKKDVISNEDIAAFKTIEINKIKTRTTLKQRRFLSGKWKLILPAVAIVMILGLALNNQPAVNPLIEDITLAEINTISVSDLPLSLQGVTTQQASHLVFLNHAYLSNDSLVFPDEEDVTGEAQLRLSEMIEDQAMKEEAEDMFNSLYENVMYLELDTVASFEQSSDYFFTIHEDGTYVLTLRTEEANAFNVIELKTYYDNNELFYQAKLEVIKDDTTNLFMVRYNEANTIKYQYDRFVQNDQTMEHYIYLEETDDSTKVSAVGQSSDEVYTVVADANDQHGVIFSTYVTDEINVSSTEYYDGSGALLKQEEGFSSLAVYNQYLDALFQDFEANPEIDLKNLSDIIDGFSQPDTFTLRLTVMDSVLARVEDVEAVLMVDTNEYAIDYSFDDLLYSKKDDAFTSGDTLYNMTDYTVEDGQVIVTFSAVYDIPDPVVGPNGQSYYINNKYMAKYIQAKEGFTIIQNESGKYQLLNDVLEGEMGDRIDIEITQESYYLDGNAYDVLVFQHTSSIQFENLEFTKMDDINAAKTNLNELYETLVPTAQEISNLTESIDVSMFID